MTVVSGSFKPKALVFGAQPDEELSAALSRYGVEAVFRSDPKEFLSVLNQSTPSVSFIVQRGVEAKIVRALLKSIRKVLGMALSIHVILDQKDAGASGPLLDAGSTGVILRPVDGPHFIELLAALMVTEELARAKDGLAAESAAVVGKLTTVLDAPAAGKGPDGAPKGLGNEPLPEVIGWVFEKVFPVMATVSTALESYDEVESKVKFYTERVIPYREFFVALVNSLRKTKDDQPLDVSQCIRFYGIPNTKTLVVADKLLEGARGKGFQWNDKTNRPDLEPAKVLTYSRKLVEHFGEDGIYKDVAFNSGLIFDLLAFYAEEAGERKAALKKEIEARVKRATERADAAIRQAKSMESMPLAKHIVTTLLMGEAGKALMALYFPPYIEFMKPLEKAKAGQALVHIAEQKKFGISHNLLGAMLCQVTPGLGPATAAVLCSHYSYMLSRGGAAPNDLSMLADISDRC